ncbi:MAG: thiol-activated cytolysin family protein [Gemmatimonadetes bacterium]|nr:thiol-activated cytolysin family protein [Gemmatimonadota bacterium]
MRRTPALTLILALAACSTPTDDGDPPPPPPPPPSQEVGQYLGSLPSWAAFSPPKADADPSPVAAPAGFEERVEADSVATDVPEKYDIRENVLYACDTTPYRTTKTPVDLVMYSPPTDILWPGALIQGKSHRDGGGNLLPLTIAERDSINVSIPSLPTGQNFRTVRTVNQANVGAAIGEMIGNAVAQNLNTGATSFFRVETISAEQQFALGVGLSGRYLGWRARTQADLSRRASQSTVSAQFHQRMFEVVVAPPQTPAGFFSSAFTKAKLDEQVALGRLGPDNLPIYVSRISYGRTMMFTLKASASASELRGLIQASYNALGQGAAATLTARQKNILSQSEIEVFSMGGADSATAAMIRSGDWRSYFTSSAPLSTAVPIAYEFKNLSDGSVARVSEVTDFTVKTCTEVTRMAGELHFLPEQRIAAPVPSPYQTVLADVSGDGRDDLIWNHLAPTGNTIAVALADATGRFGTPKVTVHPGPPAPEGWANYRFLVGDITGDGRADLLWSRINVTNTLYTAVTEANGSFRFLPVQQFGAANWGTGYQAHLGRFDALPGADLVFNSLAAGVANRSYILPSELDGTFDAPGAPLDYPGGLTGWSPYALQLADLNRDGLDDFVWSNVPGAASPNRTYVGLRTATGINFLAARDHSTGCCWTPYRVLLADFDGDQIPDLYWNKTSDVNFIHRFRGLGNGTWSQLAGIDLGTATLGFDPSLGDLNDDGVTDIVWTRRAADRLDIRVGLSNAGTISLATAGQSLTDPVNWLAARVHVGLVSQDTRADVVVVIPESTTRVFVGAALP